MSSLSKMLSILDLFTVEKPTWSSESICEYIGCSTPTGYRYVRELVTAGLLARLGNGSYALGPRVMTLDYQLRTVDPFFCVGQPLMEELATRTGCDCVMTCIFDDEIVDTHRASGADGLHLTYGRGRPRPLFQGAAPKVILSTLSRARLSRLFEKHTAAIRQAGMGQTLEDFLGKLRDIRKAGFYVSKGELEADVGAIAVPLFANGPQAVGALAIVVPLRRFEFMHHEKLLELIQETAGRISVTVTESSLTQ